MNTTHRLPTLSDHAPRSGTLEQVSAERGLRMTRPRRLVIQVIEAAGDHPDILEIHRRVRAVDPRISLATVYRTVKVLEDLKLVLRHRFGDGPSRYELATIRSHDHLIDLENSHVIEFRDARIEAIQNRLADELGYEILSYRLEIFAVPARQKPL
jgi:Fur family transcriptional regulator, ferric uptake regulator